MFKFEAANLTGEFGFDDVDAGIEIRAFVLGRNDFATWDFHSDGEFEFVTVVTVDLGDDNFGDDVFFVGARKITIELADFLQDVFLEVVFNFIIANIIEKGPIYFL